MIKTKSGVLIPSDDSKVLVFDGFDHKYKLSNQLCIGDTVCLKRGVVCSKKEFKINFKFLNKSKHATNIKEVNLPNINSENLSEWLGLLVANGCKSKDSVKFSTNAKPLEDRFNFLTKELFGVFPVNRNYSGCGDNIIHSVIVREFLDYLCGVFTTARYKTVPECVVKGTDEEKRLFLRALFDCDSSYSNGEFEYSTASESLVREVHAMLLSKGVVSFLRGSKVKGYGEHLYWKLYVRGEESDKLFDSVMVDSLKYSSVVRKKRNTNVDVVYGLFENINEKVLNAKRILGVKGNGVYTFDGKKKRFVASKTLNTMNCHNISYHTLQKVFEDFKNSPNEQKDAIYDVYKKIEEILENRYFYDKVSNISTSSTMTSVPEVYVKEKE